MVIVAGMLMVTGLNAAERIQPVDLIATSLDKIEINPFCKAIVQGDLDTVKKFIALGEDVNRKSLGKTPAIFAARYNRAEILKVLILNGANLSIKCERGYSVKKYAEMSNASEALQVIEEALQS